MGSTFGWEAILQARVQLRGMDSFHTFICQCSPLAWGCEDKGLFSRMLPCTGSIFRGYWPQSRPAANSDAPRGQVIPTMKQGVEGSLLRMNGADIQPQGWGCIRKWGNGGTFKIVFPSKGAAPLKPGAGVPAPWRPSYYFFKETGNLDFFNMKLTTFQC